MLLTLDIGNSAVKGGLFDDGTLIRVFGVDLGPDDDAILQSGIDTWTEALHPHLHDVSVEHTALVSVVPPAVSTVTEVLTAMTEGPITRIRPEMSLPFVLDYDTPDTLGTDRLAAAAAGWTEFGRSGPSSVVVVDAGTAVNYEVVHRDGVYQGGAIDAGPRLVQEALCTGTAQLPPVPLTLPDEAVGRSTQTALQSGIMWGLVDGVRGMVDRLSSSLPDTPKIVLTGGWSALLAEALDATTHRRPHLVLEGARVLTRQTS